MPKRAYQEKSKRRARSIVLKHAVDSLTLNRDSSPLVTMADFELLLEYCVQYIERYTTNRVEPALLTAKNYWNSLYAGRVGHRKAEELQILFLAGPDPLNDLAALMDLGVLPHNIWAVEGDKQSFNAAV